MPSRPLLFLYLLARVHQEDRSSSLTCYPSAHQGHAIQVHIQNVLSKCTLRTCYPRHTQNVLSKCTHRTCYPSAHSERAIQVHTQNVLSKFTLRMCYPSSHSERAIQVHTQNVLSKCTLRTCYPSAHSERAKVHGIRMHHSRTLMHH